MYSAQAVLDNRMTAIGGAEFFSERLLDSNSGAKPRFMRMHRRSKGKRFAELREGVAGEHLQGTSRA